MEHITSTTFLRARDSITGARGSDILHVLKTATIGNTERYTLWLEAFNRLTAQVAEDARAAEEVAAAKIAGRVGGTYRAVIA